MKPRLALLIFALVGLWLAPIMSWVTVLETPLSGYEVFPLTGLLPWLFLLFVFVANYSKRPGAISLIGALVAAGAALWLTFANLGTFSAVQESYESQTGLALSSVGVTVSGAHYLYSALLFVAAVALLLFESTKREKVRHDAESEFDTRSLWEDQQ